MANKSIALLLILFMGISPVVSAFAYCPDFGNREIDHSSSVSVAIDVDIDNPMAHDMTAIEGQENHPGMDCHSSGSCVFHLCGGCGLTASTYFFSAFPSNSQALPADIGVYDVTLAPEIKPPIHIL